MLYAGDDVDDDDLKFTETRNRVILFIYLQKTNTIITVTTNSIV